MPHFVKCPKCAHAWQAPQDVAGLQGACPQCQEELVFSGEPLSPSQQPAIAAEAATVLPSGDELRAQMFSGFQGSLQRVNTSLLYRLGILWTAVLMVLLPLAYLAIIGLIGLAVYWHLTHHHVILNGAQGRGSLLVLLIYLAPIAVGCLLILFMIKPLFARPAQERRRRTLTPETEPLLFEFVAKIAKLVGAPRPRQIDIDCDINASASFGQSWWSLLTGRGLVLTIGMPLVAGLSLQQFAGVLAHEFGHFSQGAGMRLTYVIRSINHWFLRAVYERDSWDEWLANASSALDFRLAWILWITMGCVWLTRRILFGLMYVGHVASGFMLRQMEFDADKYEARLAGNESFAATCRQLRLLGLAYQAAQHELSGFYREGRLVDNFPVLIVVNARQLPAAAQQFIEEQIANSSTGLFDDHPADKDRIAAASADNATGVFRSDLPATVLFTDFESAAKNVTWDFYCAALGEEIEPHTLRPVAELLSRHDQDEAASQARNRYFAGSFTPLRPLRAPTAKFGSQATASLWQQSLHVARSTMELQAAAYAQALQALDEGDARLVQAWQAQVVISTGVPYQRMENVERFQSAPQAGRRGEEIAAELARLGAQMEAFEAAAGERLMAGLALLADPEVAARLPQSAAWLADCRRLRPVVTTVASHHSTIMALRNALAVMSALLAHVQGNENRESLIREILNSSRRVLTLVSELRAVFQYLEYPFDHAKDKLTVADYIVKSLPPEEHVGAILEVADDCLNGIMEIYVRALGRLCLIAEGVETELGLQPLGSASPGTNTRTGGMSGPDSHKAT